MKKLPWQTKKLGEICEEINKKNRNGLELPVYTVSHIYGLIPYQKIFYKRVHSKDLSNYKIVDYLNFAVGLPTKDTFSFGLLKEKRIVLVSPAYFVFKVRNNSINPFFLNYLLKTTKIKNLVINIASSRSAIRHGLPLKFKDFANIKVSLPPIIIQQKIVYVLDAIQEAIGVQEKIIEKTKELKKAMMADLFKYGGPSFRKGRKLKKTEIGEIPEDWKISNLEDITEIYDSKRIPLSERKRQEMRGNYPYCGANGIVDYINDYIFDGEYVLLAEDGGYWGPFELSAYIMKGKFWVNNHAHVLKVIESKSINFYLVNVLNYLDLSHYISGTTRGKLNQCTMRLIKIPLPFLPEQREIAEILQTIDQKIEIEQKKKALYEELFKTMLNKLMSGEIKIDNFSFEEK